MLTCSHCVYIINNKVHTALQLEIYSLKKVGIANSSYLKCMYTFVVRVCVCVCVCVCVSVSVF